MLLTRSWRTCVNTVTLWCSRPSWYRDLIIYVHSIKSSSFIYRWNRVEGLEKFLILVYFTFTFLLKKWMKFFHVHVTQSKLAIDLHCQNMVRAFHFCLLQGEWRAYPSGDLVARDVAWGPWRSITPLLWWAQCQGYVCCAWASTCHDGKRATDTQRDLLQPGTCLHRLESSLYFGSV